MRYLLLRYQSEGEYSQCKFDRPSEILTYRLTWTNPPSQLTLETKRFFQLYELLPVLNNRQYIVVSSRCVQ